MGCDRSCTNSCAGAITTTRETSHSSLLRTWHPDCSSTPRRRNQSPDEVEDVAMKMFTWARVSAVLLATSMGASAIVGCSATPEEASESASEALATCDKTFATE